MSFDYRQYDIKTQYDRFNRELWGGSLRSAVPCYWTRNVRRAPETIGTRPITLPYGVGAACCYDNEIDDIDGGTHGLTETSQFQIGMSKQLITSERMADQLLLHEMIHLNFAQELIWTGDHGQNVQLECQRLSNQVGYTIPLCATYACASGKPLTFGVVVFGTSNAYYYVAMPAEKWRRKRDVHAYIDLAVSNLRWRSVPRHFLYGSSSVIYGLVVQEKFTGDVYSLHPDMAKQLFRDLQPWASVPLSVAA